MKNLIFLILLVSLNSYSQEKEKIIFLFENGRDTVINSQSDNIYMIEGKHTFKFINSKHEKVEVNFNSVKEHLVTYKEFLKKNKSKKYPELFSNYVFYILIKEKNSSACLIQVEKVWLVEDKIVD